MGLTEGLDPVPLRRAHIRQTLVVLALLVLGAVLARYHVANQSYYPVAMLASADVAASPRL